jgi:hypothetical protein
MITARSVRRRNIRFRLADEPRPNFKLLFSKAATLALLLLASAGCSDSSLGGPDRIFPVSEEITSLQPYLDDGTVITQFNSLQNRTSQVAFRNAVITARMYAIDLEYSSYEARITREGQIVDFATKLTEGTLTTVASLVPAASTGKALSATATAVNGVDSQYNAAILRNQIIQNVESSMRTARHQQASVIYANLYCSAGAYPIGMALSDIEAYYRAGTFQTGLIQLMQTVSKAETDSKATQDSTKPGSSPDATATVKANQAAATAKANTAQKTATNTATSADCTAPSGVPGHSQQVRNYDSTSTAHNAPAPTNPSEPTVRSGALAKPSSGAPLLN